MATWKKVITSSDTVAVAQGGTGAASFSDGVALTNDAGTSGSVYTYLLPAGQMLMGTTGGIPTGGASDASSDVTFSGESSVALTIGNDKVTGLHVKDSDLTWTTHIATNAALANHISYYDVNGAPQNLAPGGDNEVLIYTGTTLGWASSSNAGTITIGDVSDSTEYPIVLETAGGNTIGTDGTVANFTYNPSTNKVTAAGGFVGDLEGTANVAKNVDITDDTSGSTTRKVIFADASSNTDLYSDSGFTFSPTGGSDGGGVLVVPNLTVSGATTTLNVATLAVDDALATFATTTGTQVDATAAGLNAGIEVYMTTAAGVALGAGKYPRVSYAGGSGTSTVSPSGWTIRKYGADDNNPVTAGIATMDYNSATTAPTVHVGLGALHCAGGDLYIQTA